MPPSMPRPPTQALTPLAMTLGSRLRSRLCKPDSGGGSVPDLTPGSGHGPVHALSQAQVPAPCPVHALTPSSDSSSVHALTQTPAQSLL